MRVVITENCMFIPRRKWTWPPHRSILLQTAQIHQCTLCRNRTLLVVTWPPHRSILLQKAQIHQCTLCRNRTLLVVTWPPHRSILLQKAQIHQCTLCRNRTLLVVTWPPRRSILLQKAQLHQCTLCRNRTLLVVTWPPHRSILLQKAQIHQCTLCRNRTLLVVTKDGMHYSCTEYALSQNYSCIEYALSQYYWNFVCLFMHWVRFIAKLLKFCLFIHALSTLYRKIIEIVFVYSCIEYALSQNYWNLVCLFMHWVRFIAIVLKLCLFIHALSTPYRKIIEIEFVYSCIEYALSQYYWNFVCLFMHWVRFIAIVLTLYLFIHALSTLYRKIIEIVFVYSCIEYALSQ